MLNDREIQAVRNRAAKGESIRSLAMCFDCTQEEILALVIRTSRNPGPFPPTDRELTRAEIRYATVQRMRHRRTLERIAVDLNIDLKILTRSIGG